jgi:hypothetical protein
MGIHTHTHLSDIYGANAGSGATLIIFAVKDIRISLTALALTATGCITLMLIKTRPAHLLLWQIPLK